ncbi:MAG: hypothetical protein ACLP9C_14915 [Acidimicrobiales bacterium]
MAESNDLRRHIDHMVERAERELLDASRQLAQGITKGSQRVVPPVSQDLERVVDDAFDFAERVLKGQRKMVNDMVKAINDERRRAAEAGRKATARAAKRFPAKKRAGAKKAAKKAPAKKKAVAKKAPAKKAPARR